jgi:hypothetical protein
MIRTRHLFFALGLAFASGIAAPGCVVRSTGSAHVGVSTTPVVYQEPPPPQVENVVQRPGYVWVKGRWDWRNNQWVWVDGHWERERSGYRWSDGRWERRGTSWHWIEGTWAAATVETSSSSGGVVVTSGPAPEPHHAHGHPGHHGGHPGHHGPTPAQPDVTRASGGVTVTTGAPVGGGMYPTVAPPPDRTERYGAERQGYIWVKGHWDWKNGQWVWVDGHWERQRANHVWVPGRWELQGSYYVWIEGRWDRAPAPSGQVRDHRR